MRLDIAKLAEPSLDLPSLEAFAESRGMEDFSQAEQIAAFEEAYGKASAWLKRRGKLISRQLDA